MRFPPIPQIETERLRLRGLRLSDLSDYHRQLTSDPEVARYMLWQANTELAHTEAVLRRRIAEFDSGRGCHWAIALKETDALIGAISLLGFQEEERSCGFAYMLGREFWGRGYGTEALRAVFRFAFEELEAAVIRADHFAENPASGAAMRKAGMKETGILPDRYEKDGILHDAIAYRITKAEWGEQR